MLPEEMVEAAARESLFEPVAVRKCTGPCSLVLPLTQEHFWRDSRTVGGFRWECKTCTTQKRRERRAAETSEEREERLRQRRERDRARMADPEWAEHERQRKREYDRKRHRDPRARAQRRERARRYYENVRADPVLHARYLETRRIADTLRRRNAGMAPVPQRSRLGAVVDSEVGERIPVARLQEAVQRSNMTPNTIGALMGWSEREGQRLRRLIALKSYTKNGKEYWSQTVSYTFAVQLIGVLGFDPVDYGL